MAMQFVKFYVIFFSKIVITGKNVQVEEWVEDGLKLHSWLRSHNYNFLEGGTGYISAFCTSWCRGWCHSSWCGTACWGPSCCGPQTSCRSWRRCRKLVGRKRKQINRTTFTNLSPEFKWRLPRIRLPGNASSRFPTRLKNTLKKLIKNQKIEIFCRVFKRVLNTCRLY